MQKKKGFLFHSHALQSNHLIPSQFPLKTFNYTQFELQISEKTRKSRRIWRQDTTEILQNHAEYGLYVESFDIEERTTNPSDDLMCNKYDVDFNKFLKNRVLPLQKCSEFRITKMFPPIWERLIRTLLIF